MIPFPIIDRFRYSEPDFELELCDYLEHWPEIQTQLAFESREDSSK